MQWTVFNMIRTVPEGVVELVCCTVSKTEGQYSALTRLNQKVPYKSPSDSGFIPFDQLTQQEVIDWVKEQLGPFKIDQIDKGLQQTINNQKVQTAQGLPW
jgi:hypothetical protein